jgi:tRNA1Val (adenine37-N6)-methyltransferase
MAKDFLRDISAFKKEGESVDEILGGRLKILQKVKGYRFSLDAFLLADFVQLKRISRVLDLGAGGGILSLILSQRRQCRHITGIEIQGPLVDIMKRNIKINRLSDKIKVCRGDVRKIETIINPHAFDAVVLNPPYRRLTAGKINPNHQKAIARHEIEGAIGDFLKAAAYALKKYGHVYIIYPAARAVELIYKMRINQLEPKRVRTVYSHRDSAGEFILVEGLKEGGEELKIMPPLFIYTKKGQYTKMMNEIFRTL